MSMAPLPGSRAERVDEFCAILTQWGEMAESKGILQKGTTGTLRMAVSKSSYLGRRLYGGEAHRERPCPEHKGTWRGLPFEETSCGCDLTGWLRQGFCVPCAIHNGELASFCTKCGESVKV